MFQSLSKVLVLVSCLGAASVAADTGYQRYLEGDFEGAIDLWQQEVTEQGAHSELWENIALAHARLGQKAEAMVYLWEAKQLAPRDPDLDHNLKLLGFDADEDRITVMPSRSLWRQVLAWGGILSARERWLLSLILWSAGVVACVLVIRANQAAKAYWALAACSVLLAAATQMEIYLGTQDPFVASARQDKVELYSAPSKVAGESILSLSEGSLLWVKSDEQGPWVEVLLKGSRRAWAQKAQLFSLKWQDEGDANGA